MHDGRGVAVQTVAPVAHRLVRLAPCGSVSFQNDFDHLRDGGNAGPSPPGIASQPRGARVGQRSGSRLGQRDEGVASEPDIRGPSADPQALVQAVAAWQAYERLGSPEGELAIAQSAVYLANAPKSNALYKGFNAAWAAAKRTGSLMPPSHILNAPTRLMKDLGYGAGYRYDHDVEGGFSGQNYFPDGMAPEAFYEPTDRGAEADAAARNEARRAKRKDGAG